MISNETATGILPVLSNAGLAGDAEKEPGQCVVRLRTTTWANSKGLHIKRSLTYLRRQCVGFLGLKEDAGAIGNITNLDQCEDGIYEIIVCNVSYDWESGYVDDWNYKLVPISTANAQVTGAAPTGDSKSDER